MTPAGPPARAGGPALPFAAVLAALLTAALLSACSSSAKRPVARPAATTVWLCQPGTAGDPCEPNLSATAVRADGARAPQPAAAATNPPLDCFYVYPTVSTEPGDNADLQIQPAETDVAIEQAARFSQVCRVWAPMYRQATLKAITNGRAILPSVAATAYDSLLAAWQDYLAHDNQGRPFVLVGHSQGAAILIQLIRSQIDSNPKLRSRLVSAIVLGGNVTVPTGRTVGGSFQHVPACASASQTGCVIAYSSFSSPPPPDSLFGRPGQGVGLLSGQTAKAGLQVLCVNPAAVGSSAAAPLEPYFAVPKTPPSQTVWLTYPNLYAASCAAGGGANWLQVNDIAGPGDHRPRVSESFGPTWGLHADDVNLALGNLVDDVRSEAAAYRAGR